MNIFVTDKNPYLSAIVLDNKRVNKMIVESCQILSTVLFKWNIDEYPYKPTHLHHPCVKWTEYSNNNYSWLFEHFVALCDEFVVRYGKRHKCSEYISLFYKFKGLWNNDITFYNCSGYNEINIFESYKKCLITKWDNDKVIPKWNNRKKPYFYNGDKNASRFI